MKPEKDVQRGSQVLLTAPRPDRGMEGLRLSVAGASPTVLLVDHLDQQHMKGADGHKQQHSHPSRPGALGGRAVQVLGGIRVPVLANAADIRTQVDQPRRQGDGVLCTQDLWVVVLPAHVEGV